MTGLTPGQLASQLELGWQLLKEVDLAGEKALPPNYARVDVSSVRKLKYLEQWEYYLKNMYYDYLLADNSLMQFRVSRMDGNGDYSFAFYECPYKSLTYPEFLNFYGYSYTEVGELYRQEFETDSLSNLPKECVTPCRYDFAPSQYVEGRHPASHIHFGHQSEVRLGTRRILKPLSFCCFVVRQHYPEHWQRLLRMPLPAACTNQIRDALNEVPGTYLNDLDEHEIVLD